MSINQLIGMKKLKQCLRDVNNRLQKFSKQKLLRQDPMHDLKLEWRLKPFEYGELKYLCMQDLLQRTPPHTDVLELGVGSGSGLQLLIKLCHQEHRQYIGFDTFSGFPDGVKEDNFFKSSSKPIYKCFDEKYLLNQLEALGYDKRLIEEIIFIKGLLPDTLRLYNGTPGFAFIDLDLYESYLESLRVLYPRMIDSGIILLDEYDAENDRKKWPGAKSAIDKFCKENNVRLQTHWTGRKYIVKVPCGGFK